VGAPTYRLIGNDADAADANVEHESGDGVSGFMPGGALAWGTAGRETHGGRARRRCTATKGRATTSTRQCLGYAAGTLASLVLISGSAIHRLPLDITEVLGFVTGAWCVWLTVKENVWNWPIGIANDAFFLVLFLRASLFADAGLQVVYIVLGVLGWYWWLRGGAGKTELPVSRTGTRTALVLAVLLVVSTAGLTIGLARVNDAAPFWDALTTVLSLVAQYMLSRKLIENWFVWMTADVIYVALYVYKHLDLTAGLYGIFFAMCVAGFLHWRASLRAQYEAAASAALMRLPQHDAHPAAVTEPEIPHA
jgi:nicotinamide mononucleotide transporter